MKLNKKLLMAALAGAIVVTGGVGSFAADGTNDAPGKTDEQKISEAQAKAKKQLDDAGVPFEKQKDVLAYPNSVYNIEQKTNEILAAKENADKELAKTDLGKAKLAAKAELKKEGYHLGLYEEAINNATDLHAIETVKENLRANKSLKTLDAYNKEEADKKAKEEAAKKPLEDAKAEALAELKKAGLGNEKNEFVKKVKDAKTVYDVDQAKNAGLAWAKENLTSIDDWNEKEAAKTRKLTIDEWLKLQEEKEGKKPEEKKPEEKKPEEKNPGITIDEWLLKEAKKDAIAELKAAGITSDLYFNAINKAKTVEGVNALKNEILKAHAGKEVNPSTPEVTPSVPENHYHENDYANIGAGEGTKEDGKKENSKEESKENGKKEDSKEDSKENGKEQKPGKEEKTGKEEKPANPAKPAKEEKEKTDSPNKKNKKKLPKAGSEAEILTLAAAALSTAAGAFVSLKKRK